MLISRVHFLARRVQIRSFKPVSSVAFYSRKSSSNYDDNFKIVERKGTDSKDEIANANIGVNPNWELLTPQGFRFYLPGNIGPAWQDALSTSNITIQGPDENSALICTVHECPVLLRQGVYELFGGLDVYGPLAVVSVAQKTKLRSASDQDMEVLTKRFVLAAQDICSKLKMAGYWADFINPFSGHPYHSPVSSRKPNLYLTDERFRCLGFRIFEKNQCRVIADRSNRNFVGSLFTTAPPNMALLRDILQQYED